jgi:tripartite-type tricarboxylate transporter receptor subunit TctC
LLIYAKANPGKIKYAGSTPEMAQHLGWELIKRKMIKEAGITVQ